MDIEARSGSGFRRNIRGTITTTDRLPRARFSLRALFGRNNLSGRNNASGCGGAPKTVADLRTYSPAEFELGRLLMSLNSEFTVFSVANVCGELDTEFVVVGPTGIYLITTLAHDDVKVWVDENMLWVDGRPTDLVRNARLSADRASTRLSSVIGHAVRATPVIAIMDPNSLSFGGDPTQRVVTLPADLVTQWLSECPRTLSDEAVAYFALVAEDRATWGSLPSGSGTLARVR